MTTTTKTPTTYRITRKAGADHGTYQGASPADALAAMCQDAGYDVIAAGPEGDRHLVWANPEDEAIAGGLDAWNIEAVEPEGEPSEDAIRELSTLTTEPRGIALHAVVEPLGDPGAARPGRRPPARPCRHRLHLRPARLDGPRDGRRP